MFAHGLFCGLNELLILGQINNVQAVKASAAGMARLRQKKST